MTRIASFTANDEKKPSLSFSPATKLATWIFNRRLNLPPQDWESAVAPWGLF